MIGSSPPSAHHSDRRLVISITVDLPFIVSGKRGPIFQGAHSVSDSGLLGDVLLS